MTLKSKEVGYPHMRCPRKSRSLISLIHFSSIFRILHQAYRNLDGREALLSHFRMMLIMYKFPKNSLGNSKFRNAEMTIKIERADLNPSFTVI